MSWKYIFDVVYLSQQSRGNEKKADEMVVGIPAAFALVTAKNEKYINSLHKSPYRRRSSAFMQNKPEFTSFVNEFKNAKQGNTKLSVNKWDLVNLCGNLLQLTGVFVYFFDLNQRLKVTNIFFGVGCFLSWLNVGRYLEYYKQYFIVFKTLFASLPTTMRFVAANIPIMLGYACWGACVFWKSDRFNSVSKAVMTEFALFLGDSVFDIFTELTAINFWMAMLWMCTFLIMFFSIIQNFFISIIQFSYFQFEDLEVKRAKLHATINAKKSDNLKTYSSKEEELEDLKKEVREKNSQWAKRIEELENQINSEDPKK